MSEEKTARIALTAGEAHSMTMATVRLEEANAAYNAAEQRSRAILGAVLKRAKVESKDGEMWEMKLDGDNVFIEKAPTT